MGSADWLHGMTVEGVLSDILQWVTSAIAVSGLDDLIMGNRYVFPALEILHFLGLCLLFGALLIIDLRIMGFATGLPLSRVSLFARIAVVGFGINVLTGMLFLTGDAARYLVNVAFWLKMFLIAMAGANTAYFAARVQPKLETSRCYADVALDAKLVACLSLVLWTCVIIAGRFIPYVEDL